MEHNRFDYNNDIIRPFKFFLRQSGVLAQALPARFNKNVGYLDKRAIELARSKHIENKSQYFNNFEGRFKPNFSYKSAGGELLNHSFKA